MSARDLDRTEALRSEFVRGIVDELGIPEAMALPYANSIIKYLQAEYPAQQLYVPAPSRQYDVLQIAAALEAGTSISRVCRTHGVSRPTLYRLFPGGLPRVREALAPCSIVASSIAL